MLYSVGDGLLGRHWSFERANERANDQLYSYVEIKDFQSHLVINTGFAKLVG